MKLLIVLVPLVAVVASSHPHVHHHHHPELVPYVVNPGGIGGIYKGPDSATIIKGPDGGVITSKQIGGAVEIEDSPPVVVPVVKPAVVHAHHVPVLHAHDGPFAGVIHTGGASAGSIHAGPVSAGSIHVGPVLAGRIHADGSIRAAHGGLIHTGLPSAGVIHTGPVSAGAIHAGPVSAGSIHAGPVSAGRIHVGPTHGGSIHAAHHDGGFIHTGLPSAGVIHAGPVSAGAIHAGPVSAGSIHVGPSSAGAIHAHAPVVLAQEPIIVPDVVVATHDPKIVEEHVVVGHKVISVPKKVEENTDLIGPSGTISTRGGDAVVSGPASITVKGNGVVTEIDKQPDVHVKTVEVRPLVAAAPLVPTVVASPAVVPAVHPVVESAGSIITHTRPAIYAPHAPLLAPIRPIVHDQHVRPILRTGPILANPVPLPLSAYSVFPHYAPAYVKHAHYAHY